jgi:(R,R)-butanediol dehydrogenase/meso-butanediol dehydrogenase/diacetyl reductase
MRAAVFSEPGTPLAIQTLPDPSPGPTDIVMKVHTCGICGTDLHMTEDHGPAFTYPRGAIPGHEYAGEVAEVGRDVKNFKVGDRICSLPFTGCGHCRACLSGEPSHCPEFRGLGSGFSEYALVSELTTVRLDERLSFDDGALVEPLAVGLHGVVTARIRPGDRVLVIGAGPIGLAAAFFARKLGAGKVAVTATSRRREAFALALGADEFLVPEKDQSLAELAMEKFGGLPDIVMECAGVQGCVDSAINTVRPKGTVVIMGFCTEPDQFVPATTMWKEVILKGSNTYTIPEFTHVANALARESLEPRKMVSDRVTLDAVPGVLESLRGPNDQCKVLINPWS